MRVVVIVASLVMLTACGSGGGKSAVVTSDYAKRCTDRMLAGIDDHSPMVRSYTQRTYCDKFAKRGWVYADGTLSIKAHLWLMQGGRCSTSSGSGPAVTIPCDPSYENFECALLHFVRKAEVQAYLAKLTETHRVVCDDGTPLDKLGAT